MRAPACLVLLAALAPGPAFAGPPMSREQALDAGKALGEAGKDDVRGAAANPDYGNVPGYQGTAVPETGYYGLGVGIEDAARQALPGHDVGRYVDDSATARPQFNVDRQDPMVRRGDTISADPESVLGTALNQEYSACEATPTTPAPATFTEERCTEWGVERETTCQKVLNVTVTPQLNCTPGTWHASYPWKNIGTYVQAKCVDENRIQFRFYPNWAHGTCDGWRYFTLPRARFSTGGYLVTQGRTNWKGACTFTMFLHLASGTHGCANDSCSYRFRITENRWYSTNDHFRMTFAEPGYRYTVTESWDDGCASLEAKTQ